MDIEGSIKSGADIGYRHNNGNRYILHACIDCGKLRWVRLRNGAPRNLRCHGCSAKKSSDKKRGANSPAWKGGVYTDKHGYRQVKLYPDDPFYPMAKSGGYVFEHRLVMARHLGRLLLPYEIVHHLDGNKENNNIKNLKLTTNGEHSKLFYRYIYEQGIIEGRRQMAEELDVKISK